MQAIYYYPTKLSITPDEVEEPDLDDSHNRRWRHKAKRLQARRWKDIHAKEEAQKEAKLERLMQARQKHWLRSHGWPRIAQPLV